MFAGAPRVVLASMLAFFTGEFVNSFALAKLKLRTSGRFLWVRTIGSTILGEAADSLIFYPVAFLGIWDSASLLKVMLTNYTLKVALGGGGDPADLHCGGLPEGSGRGGFL